MSTTLNFAKLGVKILEESKPSLEKMLDTVERVFSVNFECYPTYYNEVKEDYIEALEDCRGALSYGNLALCEHLSHWLRDMPDAENYNYRAGVELISVTLWSYLDGEC